MAEQKVKLTPQEEEYKKLAEEILLPHIGKRPFIQALLNANIKRSHHKTIYLRSIWEQRTDGPNNAGSSFEPGFTYEDFLRAFTTADYKLIAEEKNLRGSIESVCRFYSLAIPGLKGILLAKELKDDDVVYAVDGHGTGSLEFGCENVRKTPIDQTILLVGVDEKGNDNFAITVFPGIKASASNLQRYGIKEGQRFTRKEVIDIAGENAVVKFITKERVAQYEELNK